MKVIVVVRSCACIVAHCENLARHILYRRATARLATTVCAVRTVIDT